MAQRVLAQRHVSRLLIVVPHSRRACGRATLVARDGGALLAPIRVLATASAVVAKRHGNSTRDRTLPFGHPPEGRYLFAGSAPPGYWPRPRRARRFGKSGAILLVGDSGEAGEAAKKGRRLFYLHGGPSDRKGRLRPTRGGFRMLDGDLTVLLGAINDAHLRGDPLEHVEVVDVLLKAPPTPGERALSRKRRAKQKLRRRDRERRRDDTPVKTGARSVSREGPKPAGIPLLAPALALAAKLLGKRKPDVHVEISRRDVLALALVITTVSACDDDPSNCEPVACDPSDPACPPSGYYCGPPQWNPGTGSGGYSGPIVDDTGGDG